MSRPFPFPRLFAVVLLLVPASARTQGPGAGARPERNAEVVRPEFELGHTYRFVTRTELRSRLPLSGFGEVVIEQQARLDTRVRVDGKEGIVLRARTEKLEVRLQSGPTSLVFDSLAPEAPDGAVARHFQAAVDREVSLTLNPDLRITSREESGRERSEAAIPGVPRLGPDELGQLVATLSQGFPKRAVGPGDSWFLRGNRTVAGAGAVEFELAYRHAGEVNFEGFRCIGIDFSGRIAGNVPPVHSGEAAGGETPVELEGGRIQGRILFDPLDRMLRHLEQNIRLQVMLPGPEGAVAEPIPVEQFTTVRLLHVVPTP